MAESKYLDGGGLTHLWSKIKAYYDAYLVTWKTSNFGTGTYNNSGKLYAESGAIVEVLDSGRITLESNSIFDLNNTQIDGDASSLSMNEFDLTVNNAEISFTNCDIVVSDSTVVSYIIKRGSGLAIFKRGRSVIRVTNSSGLKLVFGYLNVLYDGSSFEVVNYCYSINVNSVLNINTANTVAVFAFWTTFDY